MAKKESGWATHKRAVAGLERMLGAKLKKAGRGGLYMVDLPARHPLARALARRGAWHVELRARRPNRGWRVLWVARMPSRSQLIKAIKSWAHCAAGTANGYVGRLVRRCCPRG